MAALGKSAEEGAADALKRQLAELGGAEALLQAVLDSASDCILVISPEGTILLSGRALPRATLDEPPADERLRAHRAGDARGGPLLRRARRAVGGARQLRVHDPRRARPGGAL